MAATEHTPALNSLWRAPGATLEARQALQAALLVTSLSLSLSLSSCAFALLKSEERRRSTTGDQEVPEWGYP